MAKPVKCAANGYSRTAGVELGWTTCVDHTCAHDGCGQPSKIEGWCEEHRFGKCETADCRGQAVGRVALSEVSEGDDGRLYRRFTGSPLACNECTDLKVRAQKVIAAAAKSAKVSAPAARPAKPQPGDEMH
jgi:hypothetical protein